MPSQREWDDREARIRELIATRTMGEVINLMKEEGFNATSSQYESRLKKWKLRKNLKGHEWKAVLKRYDAIVSEHPHVKLLLGGQELRGDKIQRLKRRYGQDKSSTEQQMEPTEATEVIPEWVSFEGLPDCTEIRDDSRALIAQAQGQEANDVEPSVSNMLSLNDQLGTHDSMVSEGLDGDDHPITELEATYDSAFEDIRTTTTYEDHLFPTLTLSSPIATPPWLLSLLQPEQLSMSQPTFWSESYHHATTDGYSDVAIPDLSLELLKDLPFSRFETNLQSKGINLGHRLPNEPANFGIIRRYNSIMLFLTDVEEIQSSNSTLSRISSCMHHVNEDALLSSFKSLLPGEQPPEEDNHQSSSLAKLEWYEANLVRLLLFSAVNGFAGLGSIPISSVLKFLGRYGNVSALLTQILHESPGPVAKALAENLFKSAIECQELEIVKGLLASGHLDVDKIICDVSGEKFTPIERAAALHSLRLTTILLDLKPDVNKTYASDLSKGGVIRRLVDKIPWGATTSPDIAQVAKALLKAGAEVHPSTLESCLDRCHDSQLICALSFEVAGQDHEALLSDDYLTRIAKDIGDAEALKMMRIIIKNCEEQHQNNCFVRYTKKLNAVAVKGAIQGHLEFVRLLLKYSNCLSKVLSASIRSGRSELISTIIAHKPDLDPVAHSIDDNDLKLHEVYDRQNTTTPLAEAIKLEDNTLIRYLEDHGALNRLDSGRRFEAALAAAVKKGNTEYFYKILEKVSNPPPQEMSVALLYSVQQDLNEIFDVLLNRGADVALASTDDQPSPLFSAVQQRKSRMVYEILNADAAFVDCLDDPYESASNDQGTSTIMHEAIRWGDRSIIEALSSAFPQSSVGIRLLKEIIRDDNTELFDFLVAKRLVAERSLGSCLKAAIGKGNTKMFYRLIETGADPTDSHIVAKATKYQTGMLPIVLEHVRQSPRRLGFHFGLKALHVAISQGSEGLEALDTLLSLGFIDLHVSFGTDMRGFQFNYSYPLGLAIRKATEKKPGNFTAVESLLKAGCSSNEIVARARSQGSSHETALLAAIKTKNEDLVQLLIDYGADVHMTPVYGVKRSPLQQAAQSGCLDIVKLLLKHQADPNTPSAVRGGGTALQYAAMSGDCNIAAELLRHGAQLDAPPSKVDGRWPLEAAAEHGRLEMIEYLWKVSGVGFDDQQCRRAMDLAENNGFCGCQDLIRDLSASRHQQQLFLFP